MYDVFSAEIFNLTFLHHVVSNLIMEFCCLVSMAGMELPCIKIMTLVVYVSDGGAVSCSSSSSMSNSSMTMCLLEILASGLVMPA